MVAQDYCKIDLTAAGSVAGSWIRLLSGGSVRRYHLYKICPPVFYKDTPHGYASTSY